MDNLEHSVCFCMLFVIGTETWRKNAFSACVCDKKLWQRADHRLKEYGKKVQVGEAVRGALDTILRSLYFKDNG